MFSIALSMTTVFIMRPRQEKRAVFTLKTRNAERVISTSEINSARPTSVPVCFCTIIAMMSVPPEEAPILNRMAEPNEGRTTAKIKSSIGSSVTGWLIGKNFSRAETKTESATLA